VQGDSRQCRCQGGITLEWLPAHPCPSFHKPLSQNRLQRQSAPSNLTGWTHSQPFWPPPPPFSPPIPFTPISHTREGTIKKTQHTLRGWHRPPRLCLRAAPLREDVGTARISSFCVGSTSVVRHPSWPSWKLAAGFSTLCGKGLPPGHPQAGARP
jgi:hypothetical protein